MRNYYAFSDYLRERFKTRVHRISLNAGFGCPNRDGTLGVNGCIFCNEKGFAHFTESDKPLKDQIGQSIKFLRSRFKAEKFIAYFQNATNTYADTATLKKTYDSISDFPEIVGLFISTRPDTIDREKLDLIESYASRYEVWIEYGLQTIHDSTLRALNRLHTFSHVSKAVLDTSKRNIKIGAHVILGLPGEKKEDMLETAEAISCLPISGVKLHVLHVLKNTKLEEMHKDGNVRLLEGPEYARLACDFLERLKPDCVIFRLVSDAKKDVLIAPEWINRKHETIKQINDEFEKRKTYQGFYYEQKNMRVR